MCHTLYVYIFTGRNCEHGTIYANGNGDAVPGQCCPGDENRLQGSCRNDHPSMSGLKGYVCWTTSGNHWGYCKPGFVLKGSFFQKIYILQTS